MRVLLSTYGSRGDVEPMLALAVRLRALGADARLCAPPDFAGLAVGLGVSFVPVGRPVRPMVTGTTPPSAKGLPERAAEWVSAQFETVIAAAEGCDVVVGGGMMPVAERSAAERLGVRHVYVTFQQITLPSPFRAPLARAGRAFPPEVTDNRALWELDAKDIGELFGPTLNDHRASLGMSIVDDVRDHVYTDTPWLATDPTLDPWRETSDVDVVQTGAWILDDDPPLPSELEEFLDAGAPPVYVGFGSMAAHAPGLRSPEDVARAVIEAIRARGRRVVVGRGWADLALIDDEPDCFAVGEVNQQALFRRTAAVVHHGGAGTTMTATRSGAPQVVVPQAVDQPYWAGRVAELGIGVAHDGSVPTAESLSAALETALTPATRERATTVAAAIRADGATVAANLLLDRSA
ncbi:glycosyltransferase [Stackebrandtia soli]|uniref:glycosyltransferase n=1 Tax=Stackebrandtia soli TaxID=1892856 RepID=UPI0039ED4598